MVKSFSKSIMAGMAIALGCCLYLLAPNPIIGAVLFSCGLLCVRIYQLSLFTGRMQYMITDKFPAVYYPMIFAGNIIGAGIVCLFTYKLTGSAAAPLAATKASQPFLEAAMKGVGCGMLMSLATYKESPLWMCLLCVPGFILAGFNHCIADAYYAMAGWNIGPSFVATIAGNIVGGVLLSNYLVGEQ